MKALAVREQLERLETLESQIALVEAVIAELDGTDDEEHEGARVVAATRLHRVITVHLADVESVIIPSTVTTLILDDLVELLDGTRENLRMQAEALEIGEDMFAPRWLSESAMERLITSGLYGREIGDQTRALPCDRDSIRPAYVYHDLWCMWRRESAC